MAACHDYDDDSVYPSEANCAAYDQNFCNGEGMDLGNDAWAAGTTVGAEWGGFLGGIRVWLVGGRPSCGESFASCKSWLSLSLMIAPLHSAPAK